MSKFVKIKLNKNLEIPKSLLSLQKQLKQNYVRNL